ncbi:Crp/Fnr family transcriptional regulator [Caminibacter mediatlanticus TB-2]|uniref:Crp/Fnr family transcriptional regulator n=1 Tax=Caminibacter mediatlanticus TB-2 TaxID=391592 RepID=A0ABX5V9L6_9BACT|nr:Crp/Fnr family transcriptional regulator [Caminibacter mediatlanticus]QCT94943.1 Crp/Fnr family transcriptional regulator [Caminibacter mediatlanticus TB-2]
MDFREIFLFKEINDELLEKIKSFSIIKNLKKDEIVFYEKESPNYLHLLVKGNVRVYKVDKNGNELIIHKFKAVSLIAERANLENIPYPANCAMDSDGVIIKIEWNKFKEVLHNSNMCFEIMNSLLKKMRYLDDLIHTNLILDTKTKIAKFIYEYPELFESLKQHNIAGLLNIKPETLSRKLKFFKEEGIIENQGSKLKIKDKEKIKEYFNF